MPEHTHGNVPRIAFIVSVALRAYMKKRVAMLCDIMIDPARYIIGFDAETAMLARASAI